MSIFERNRRRELEATAHRAQTDLRAAWVRLAKQSAANKLSHLEGVVREASSGDENIKLHKLKLLSGQLPDGKVEDSTEAEGELDVRSMWSYLTFAVGDVVVAFETIAPYQESLAPSPGLADFTADDLANATADDLSNAKAGTESTGEDALWWGFKPGLANLYYFVTYDVILAATWDKQTKRITQGFGEAYPAIEDPANPGQYTYDDTGDTTRIYQAMTESTDADRLVVCDIMDGRFVIILEIC